MRHPSVKSTFKTKMTPHILLGKANLSNHQGNISIHAGVRHMITWQNLKGFWQAITTSSKKLFSKFAIMCIKIIKLKPKDSKKTYIWQSMKQSKNGDLKKPEKLRPDK